MMEKISKLAAYLDKTKQMLESPLTAKRASGKKPYQEFLQREIDRTAKKIDLLRDTLTLKGK